MVQFEQLIIMFENNTKKIYIFVKLQTHSLIARYIWKNPIISL